MFAQRTNSRMAAIRSWFLSFIQNMAGKRVYAPFGVGLALLFLLTASSSPAQAATVNSGQEAGCGLAWRVVSSPNPGGIGASLLYEVAAISANDVWAVGLYYEDTISVATILHWDGIQWNIAPTPNIDMRNAALYSVVALSTTNIWAVGYSTPSTGGQQAFLIQRIGSQWRKWPTPSGAVRGLLQNISAAAFDDVWAVGYIRQGVVNRALIMHWDDNNWTVVPSPQVGAGENYLYTVEPVSANDAWAVGYRCESFDCTTDQPSQTLIMRWNGTAWNVVPSPNPGAHGNYLFGVAAVSANDVWAVGGYGNTEAEGKTLTMRWNGTAWNVVPSPNLSIGTSFLSKIDAAGANNVWAVGNSREDTRGWEQIIMRWDGSRWVTVPGPATGVQPGTYLADIEIRSANDVWAVGHYNGGTVTQRYSDPGRFSDVSPGDPFYPHITCLACRGIIGGYDDGTFRPANSITRGQVAKIVAESAGFSDNPNNNQRFEDVPLTHPFYTPIYRLAIRGILGGYPCGGTGEPCGTGNRPYFRPTRDVTRGQIAKIISNSAGYGETPTTQRFEDVPPTHPFYTWVERLASRNAMDGYACGTVSPEPCVGPTNRPYFRWGLHATREQVAKITANTFFPNCRIPSER